MRAIETLAGRRFLMTGSTGFIGKVTLAMALDRQPELKALVLVRKLAGQDAEERFFQTILRSEAFGALRDKHGEGFESFVRDRVQVVPGDATLPRFGLSEETIGNLRGNVDFVLNVAGLVSLNPGLDDSLQINAHGARFGAELAVALGAKLVHMSTAYVAGLRDGRVSEDEPIAGRCPRGSFDAEAELLECERAVAGIRAQAEGEMAAEFRRQAQARLREKGRDPADERAMRATTATLAKRWLEERLVEEGRRRAREKGWPNVYCYTKAIGEQLISATPGLGFAIVRPSIVESAIRYPFPGWNEGLNTSAPVILSMCSGHILWPGHSRAALDVIPVDLVAGATLAAAAAAIEGQQAPVYHLASSDVNPLAVRRCMIMVGQYSRRHYRDHAPGSLFFHWLRTRPGVWPVPGFWYRHFGVPAYRRAAERVANFVPLKALGRMVRDLRQIEHVVDTFYPFIHEIDCVFQTDRLRQLYAQMAPEDRAAIPWNPEAIDWRHYWFDVHIAGLRKWVFPGFDGRALKPSVRGSAFNRAVRAALTTAQRAVYTRLFRVRVFGAHHIPAQNGFLVVSNHTSHLDMGLVKHSLGPAGRDVAALAARDYFFSTALKRFFFGNFTNLLPINRRAGLKDSLELAAEVMKSGRNVLIFPEGTRSVDGAIAPFKPSLGFLALNNRTGVLPMYVRGSFKALPKGRLIPRSLTLEAHIGPFISYEELHRHTRHLERSDGYRAATALVESAVRRLERAAEGAHRPPASANGASPAREYAFAGQRTIEQWIRFSRNVITFPVDLLRGR